ncbi:MAG: hypothetical protein HC936_19365 [Leptolyngbyaceae cyanobacterium SU_3_3]|nr:hypothetical protein [Leptolyngbyaceae cyanobacterium SU_3_3]
MLVDRRRIGFLEGICRQYQSLLRKLKQTVLAEVTSAIDLSDDQKHTICEKGESHDRSKPGRYRNPHRPRP